jgi:hypothetical protein
VIVASLSCFLVDIALHHVRVREGIESSELRRYPLDRKRLEFETFAIALEAPGHRKIWMRRCFNPGEFSAAELESLIGLVGTSSE